MYSMQPIPAIDTLNSHVGFWMCIFFAMFIWVGMVLNGWKWWGAVVILSIPLGIVGVISWNTGSITTYANTPVQATLVDYAASTKTETHQTGKTHSTVIVNKTYVIYSTPDGNVTFESQQGVPYPTTAVLYKN